MNKQLKIIDEICKNYSIAASEFDIRKCLTYLDELEQSLTGNKKVVSLVSFTALMQHYIDTIEKDWLINIRNKYGFDKGTPIHFTNIRKIAQIVKYYKDGNQKTNIGWNDEYVIFKGEGIIDFEKGEFKEKPRLAIRKDFIEEYKIWKLFRIDSGINKGELDFIKLQQFYEDILEVIRKSEISVLCTSVLYDSKALHKERFKKEQIKTPHVIAFSEHLDLLVFYLKHGFLSDEDLKKDSKLYSGSFSTKLRWDGDDGFNQKHDYRLLFNKVVSLGTSHFQSDVVRKCLDEIRFVNKREIGYYDNLEKQNLVSHIGCDIADFIAYYVGKYSVKNLIIEMEVSKGKTKEEAEEIFTKSVTFKIGDRVFNPYEEAIKEKIISNNEYTSVQIIKECHYNILT